MKKSKGMAVMALAALGLLLNVNAQARVHDKNDIEVDVVTDDRGVLRQYSVDWRDDGAERSYVAARDNERYSLRIRNHTDRRVGVVIAVDGRNIISGKKSHLKSSESMYVLDPWQAAEYEGWRTAKNRINRFYFTGMDDSYAATWDDYSAMGVIAVAVFAERRPRKAWQDFRRGHGSTELKKAVPMREAPGTGMGEDAWSPSRKVRFKPQKRPILEKFIKYEWRSTLCRKGIVSCRGYHDYRNGNRFWPGDEWGSRDGYARRRW